MWNKRTALIGTASFALIVALIWVFPPFWYTHSGESGKPIWFSERTNIAGWTYREIPVSESAERLLVADRTVNGEFSRPNQSEVVRVFSAKRYTYKPHDTGLFIHTPDRCWTLGGWKFEPVVPDNVELTVHGVRMVFERRIFIGGGHRELVYFGGLVGGHPLPYRLDHNLSVGMRFAVNQAKARTPGGAVLRTGDKRLWQRIWDGFTSRRQILGPKQFLRISTPVRGSDLAPADRLLQSFLESWLAPEDYEAELQSWLARKT